MTIDDTTTSVDTERIFWRLVANTLIMGVTSSFLWFAVTFWVYLETRSVVATGVIGAAFGLSSALMSAPQVGGDVEQVPTENSAMSESRADDSLGRRLPRSSGRLSARSWTATASTGR